MTLRRRRSVASPESERDEAREQAERLEAEIRRLRRALDALPIGVVLADHSGQTLVENIAARNYHGHAAVLLSEAVDQVRAAADVAEVPLSIVAPVPSAELVCDRRQVLSAVVNLLENAVKYSEPGEPVEVAAQLDGDRVRIDVRDHGIGIPKRDLERIFERFYRVDRARGRQTGGTGLGLSIVRHVAQAHGGEVTVESVEGEGSTFSLLLPDVHQASPREPGDPQTRPNGHRSFTGISEAS